MFVSEALTHYGILGMKWGVRRTPEQLGRRAERKDLKWVNKKGSRITSKVKKSVSREMSNYERTELRNQSAVNKSGRLSKTYVNQYNKKLASLMNERVSGIQAPSGRVLRYIAKRGEVGVHTALADQGYNMQQVKNGIHGSGRVAYRQDVLRKA